MKYYDAIRDAQAVMMRNNKDVFICGLGVPDPKGVFGTTSGLIEEFGKKRVFDTPACENGTVGMLIGAAMQELRPIMVNQRVDFVLLALDQIINHASKWQIMFGGAQKIPIVIRVIVGKGWGQGPQHSQSMHALFSHIPGLRVVAPATPKDAKGLLISSIEDDAPVIFIEHRKLHNEEGDVPEGVYRTPIGKAEVLCEGGDVTIVAISQMVLEAKKAAKALQKDGVSCEIIDLRSLRPLDTSTVIESVKKTGRLVVADGDWRNCSVSGEIVAIAAENCHEHLKASPQRVTWPDIPVPTSVALEKAFYPTATDIYAKALKALGISKESVLVEEEKEEVFQGPF